MTPDQIRARGCEWPKLEAINKRQVLVGDEVDLAATLKRLEADYAFYDREIEQMYAFARQWNASVDDITDKREEYGEARLACDEAIKYVQAVIAKVT